MDIQTFASGSSGNCSLVTSGSTYILLDAGISMRRIVRSLNIRKVKPEDVNGIVLTHEHTDHIKGLKMLFKYWHTDVYASHGTAEELYRLVPESRGKVVEITAGKPFEIGNIAISAVRTPHDAAESVGFTFTSEGKKISYFTDIGKITREIVDAVLGSDTAVIEANHDIEMLKNGRYPYYLKARILSDRGHLSNKRCGDFSAWLAENGTKNIVLAHLSRENNTPDTAYNTVMEALSGHSTDTYVSVAPADEAGDLCIC